MLRNFARSALALAAAASMVTAATASASVRPGQSLVSAEAAARQAPVVAGQRTGAPMQDASQLSPAHLLAFLALLAFGWGVYELFNGDGEPESP